MFNLYKFFYLTSPLGAALVFPAAKGVLCHLNGASCSRPGVSRRKLSHQPSLPFSGQAFPLRPAGLSASSPRTRQACPSCPASLCRDEPGYHSGGFLHVSNVLAVWEQIIHPFLILEELPRPPLPIWDIQSHLALRVCVDGDLVALTVPGLERKQAPPSTQTPFCRGVGRSWPASPPPLLGVSTPGSHSCLVGVTLSFPDALALMFYCLCWPSPLGPHCHSPLHRLTCALGLTSPHSRRPLPSEAWA